MLNIQKVCMLFFHRIRNVKVTSHISNIKGSNFRLSLKINIEEVTGMTGIFEPPRGKTNNVVSEQV